MSLRILSFLFVLHTLLFANTSVVEESIQKKSSEVMNDKSSMAKQEVDVSFSNESVLFMLVLTSLLGTFFLKNELPDSF